MIISKLKIENYKSIESMKLEFVEGKNIIVGQNNSGKSNIISAINLVIGEKYPSKRFDEKFYFQNSDYFYIILQLSNCSDFDKEYLNNYNKKTGIYSLDNDLNYLINSPDQLDEMGFSSSWKDSSQIIELIESAKYIYISLFSKKNEDTIYTLTLQNYDGSLCKFKFLCHEM